MGKLKWPFAAFVLLAAPLTLAACAPSLLPSSPRAVADQTQLDEQAALGVELAYQATAIMLKIALTSGSLTGEDALRAAEMDARAYRTVTAVRAAYDAGNAQSYAIAVVQARQAVSEIVTLVKGNT